MRHTWFPHTWPLKKSVNHPLGMGSVMLWRLSHFTWNHPLPPIEWYNFLRRKINLQTLIGRLLTCKHHWERWHTSWKFCQECISFKGVFQYMDGRWAGNMKGWEVRALESPREAVHLGMLPGEPGLMSNASVPWTWPHLSTRCDIQLNVQKLEIMTAFYQVYNKAKS